MEQNEQSERVTPTSLSISSLLNNPHANSSSVTRPSSREIPLVHLSSVPTASMNDFATYTSEIGPEYEDYLRAKQYGLKQHLQSNQLSRKPRASSIFSGVDGIDSVIANQLSSSVTASSRVSFDESSSMYSGVDGSPRTELGNFSFLSKNDVPLVPDIFGSSDFDLKNPRTFDLVSGNAHIVSRLGDSRDTPLSSSSQLQEMLSSFLDTVESTLVEDISATGPIFFDALHDLKQLQKRAEVSTALAESLRSQLARLSEENAGVRMQLAMQTRKSVNIKALESDISDLQDLSETYDQVSSAAQKRDTRAAMKSMTEFQSHLDRLPKLSQLKVVEQMQYEIGKIKYSLGQSDIASFKSVLLQDLAEIVAQTDLPSYLKALRSRHIRSAGQAGDQGRISTSEASTDELRTTLDTGIDSLLYTDQVEVAYLEYRDATIKASKAITKRHLPTSGEDDDDTQSTLSGRNPRKIEDKSNALAKLLRDLTAEDFLSMLRNIFLGTCIFVRRVTMQQKLLIDLISSSTRPLSDAAQATVYGTQLALNIVDISHARIVKVLNVRAAANLTLSIQEIKEYSELCQVFNAECEALTGQFGASLQSVVASQIKAYFARFSESRMQTLLTTLEVDTWQPSSVSNAVQSTVDHLLDSTMQNPSAWNSSLPVLDLSSEHLSGPLKHITIQDTKYILPISALVLISAVEQLLSFGQMMPVTKLDSVNSTLELLRNFNSRSCQLILGAGATRGTGLERITAKHLAVTSQAISFISTLIPNVKSYVMRSSSVPVSTVNEFDKVHHLYGDHRTEIHGKLISIMEDRTAQICRQLVESMQGIRNDPTASQSQEPLPYMSSLVRDSLVLARVLTKFLEADALKEILEQVIDIEETMLAAEYTKLAGEVSLQPQISIDKAHFISKLSSVSENVGRTIGAGEST